MTDTVDLHIHTSYSSDGDHTPLEIVTMAQECGFRAISIADHDTVEGCRQALQLCHDFGLEVIPNVEITTFFQGSELHLLSYFIDIANPGLLRNLAMIRDFDEQRIQKIVVKLQSMGVDVTYDEVKALSPHAPPKCSLAIKAAMNNGRNQGIPLFRDYVEGSRADQPYHNFFLDHMRPGGQVYIEPLMQFPTTEAVELVLACGGLPILAHPGGSLVLPDNLAIIDTLCGHGLCGLEVYSSYHNEESEALLVNYCAQHDLAVTAGSDFHGASVKPNIHMGTLRNNPFALVEELRKKRQAIHGV